MTIMPHLDPPLLVRLGVSKGRHERRLLEARSERALMARSLGYLFAASATLSSLLVWTFPVQINQDRMLVTSFCGYTLALVLLVAYDRLPKWVFAVFLAMGTVLIEWTIYSGGESTSAFAMLYVWIAIYAFYFFSPVEASFQLVFIVLSYAAVLTLLPNVSTYPVVRWAVTTSALIGAGALIGLLKGRVDRLVIQLGEASRSDPETGLLNRRAFQEALAREVERSRRSRRSVALAVGDIGVLQESLAQLSGSDEQRFFQRLGELVSSEVRTIDAAARIAPSTIALVLSDSSDYVGHVVVEGIQRKLTELFAAEGLVVAVPFGVASCPLHAGDETTLLAAANDALHEALHLGGAALVRSSHAVTVDEPILAETTSRYVA
jgi:diguanylate cyclase (GGDEF)-like protein